MTQQEPPKTPAEDALVSPSFQILVSQFGTQAMMELGEIANPLTGQCKISLPRARFTIDMLEILREKTQGNLQPDEQQFLEAALYNLQTRYLEHQKKASQSQAD